MLAAIVIFLFMGNFSYLANIPINKIPLSGPDLTFIIYHTQCFDELLPIFIDTYVMFIFQIN